MRGCGAYRVGEEIDRGPRGRRSTRSLRAVETYDGVEVEGSTLLEFGDLAEGEPEMVTQLTAWDSCVDGEFAAESSGETLPELPGMVVEEDSARVVVGLRVKARARRGRAPPLRRGLPPVSAPAGRARRRTRRLRA